MDFDVSIGFPYFSTGIFREINDKRNLVLTSVADPDPGSGAFLSDFDPGSGIRDG
jgi:hypothetical protein